MKKLKSVFNCLFLFAVLNFCAVNLKVLAADLNHSFFYTGTKAFNTSTGPNYPLIKASVSTTETFKISFTRRNSTKKIKSQPSISQVFTAPTANNDVDFTYENTIELTNVVGNDTSPTGSIDPATVVIKSAPSHGTATARPDGYVSYNPSPNYYGSDSYTYVVNDNMGVTSNVATVNITIYAKPTSTPISVLTIEGKAVLTDVSAQVSSPDGTIDKTSVVIMNPPAHGIVQISTAKDGTVIYTPDNGFFGNDSYSATVKDSHGAISDPVNVTIKVDSPPVITDANVNTPPSTQLITNIVNYTTEATGQGNIDKTSVTILSSPNHGTAVAKNDGTVLYTPVSGYVGADNYSVSIKNTSGNVSNTATVSILVDVAPINHGGNIIAVTSPSSGAVVNTNILPFIQNSGGSSALDKTSTLITQNASHGTAVSNGDGTISYTPASGYYGSDAYGFSIADNLGLRSNSALVNITVYTQPILKSQNLLAVTRRLLHIDVQSGATDPNGTLISNSDSIVVEPSHGKLTLNSNGTVDYVSDSAYHGQETFSIVAKDDHGTISIPANYDLVVDMPPLVRDTVLRVVSGQPFSYNAALKPVATDVDGTVDPSSIVILQPPHNGIVTINANGTFIYTSNPKYFGRDSLQYAVKDNLGVYSAPARVIIATAYFADLAISSRINNTDLPQVSGYISLTLTVINNGPDKATSVRITDSLPNSLDRAVFQMSSLGKVNITTSGKIVLWSVDTIQVGQSVNMTFQVRVKDGGTIIDSARVKSNEVDLVPANNLCITPALKTKGDDIFIPNIITPNGDGKNDYFTILGTEQYKSAELHVFSRWGTEVFQSANYHNTWDGSQLLNGTYYYLLNVTSTSGIQTIHKGWVQIQR